MIPEQVGRYEIKSQLGQGGMASVYRAFDPRFKREVAVKILPRQLMLDDPQFRTRFEREAETIAALEHPAIVPVYDFGEENGQPYLVMRLMSGGSLANRIAEGPIATTEAARILNRIGSALDRAHEHGIIHRDLKPGNILFDQYGDAYLADFGIVRLTQQGETLTATGGIVGTPAYMSPEQIQGSKVDGRSDIYALGIIVFEMLTGKKPFEAPTPAMMLVKQMTEPMPRVLDVKPDLPAACEEVITRATAKEAEQRFGRAGEMAETLNMALQHGTITVKSSTPEPTVPTPQVTPVSPEEDRIEETIEPSEPEVETAVSTSARRFSRRTTLLGVLGLFLFTIFGLLLFIFLANRNNQADELQPEVNLPNANEPVAMSEASTALISLDNVADIFPQHQLGRGNVESAELSPDGQMLAVGSSVGIWIYDVHTLEPLKLLKGHTDIVQAVAWSPDGSRIASGGWDNTLRLWDVNSGEQIGIIETDDQFIAVVWSPNGEQILATTWGSPILIFEVATTRQIGELVGFEDTVHHVRFSPDGRWLAAADSNEHSTIRVWDAESGQIRLEFPAHDGPIGNLSWAPDSTQLMSTGADEESLARVWQVVAENAEIRFELIGHEYGVYDIAYSPDGREIVTSGGDNLLMVWDAENGRKITDLLATTTPIIRIIPLADSNQYILIQADGVFQIVNATNGNAEKVEHEHTSDTKQVAWSPDNLFLATANSDGTIRLWNKTNGEQVANWLAHEYGVTALVWTPAGKRIVSAGEDGAVRLWNIENQTMISEWHHPDGSFSSLALSPDGNKLAAADWAGFMWLVNIDLKNIIHEWHAHDDAITHIAWSPDNHHLASSSADRVVTIWDSDDLESPLFLEKQGDLVSDVAWAPNGTRLATTSHDFTVRVWHAETGEALWQNEHFELASSVAWSPDGTIIASGGWDQVIRLWRAEDGKPIGELKEHVGPVVTLDWAKDGAALASGSGDGTAIIWGPAE